MTRANGKSSETTKNFALVSNEREPSAKLYFLREGLQRKSFLRQSSRYASLLELTEAQKD
jgi:hypothetical protein